MFDDYLASTSNMELVSGGEKLILLDREPPMTIIAAMWESEQSLLIAAESRQIETSSVLPVDEILSLYMMKVQIHPSAPLAWGTCGNPTIGIDRFGSWLKEYIWPPKNWQTFQDDVARELSRLNGTQREIKEIAKVESKPDHLADALIVAWLDTPGIFEVDQDGTLSVIKRERIFHAIGSGGAYAKLLFYGFHAAVKLVKASITNEETFRHVLEMSARTAPHCSPPVHIWRVTREGIIEL